MIHLIKTAAALLACWASISLAVAAPVGNTFTYQGRLNFQGAAVAQPQDLEFRLFDALSGGAQIGTAIVANNVTVTNGLFTAPLDFGPNAFGNEARFLEIKIKPAGSEAQLTTLNPRQPITPAPVSQSVTAGGVDSTAIAPGAVSSTAIAAGAVTSTGIADGSVTRQKVSADFTPILVAESTNSQFITVAGSLKYFDYTSKSAGFSGGFASFTPEQSGYYMVSVSLSISPDSPYAGKAALYVNGMHRHDFGAFSPGTPLHAETWLQLAQGQNVNINVLPAQWDPYTEVDAGAQLRIVRLD